MSENFRAHGQWKLVTKEIPIPYVVSRFHVHREEIRKSEESKNYSWLLVFLTTLHSWILMLAGYWKNKRILESQKMQILETFASFGD